ncbi:FAD-dependent oxidoreductase [Microcella alkalica]|uniref:FAD-dependent oxidoreductase n=1 Tax=Microcella alkalica TaxID=355930 RepID=UPI00145EDA1D|nr:FAD-dependent oxidoreductase [Microcella alkalica]
MTSLWIDRAPHIETDPFEQNARYDVVVVGAGLTGLTTALLLARAGQRVAVIESRRIGAVTTGNTTAKLSLLQGTHLQQIAARATRSALEAYVEANREGQSWMLRYAADHGIDVQRRDAYSYAESESGHRKVEQEHEVARAVGLPTQLTDALELPYATHGAVMLPDQAQFDPMQVLATLAGDVRAHGGVVIDGVSVTGTRTPAADDTADLVEVTTSRASVWGRRVVLATGIPVMDRGLYWARMTPQRSYAAAFRVPGSVPLGQYLSVDSPSRSVRTTPDHAGDGELLVIGGAGHPVGRHGTDGPGGKNPSPAARIAELTAWTEQHWPGSQRTHVWSAQDYEPTDGIPFVGWVPFTKRRIAMATGYDKWGMTNAVQAALQLSARLLDGELPGWAEEMGRRPAMPRSIVEGIVANAKVAWWYGRGLAHVLTTPLPAAAPAEGSGMTGRSGRRLEAVSRVDGRVCAVSPLCSHLGAPLNWNDLERSWDCPAHGSRFAPDGRRLEGPAKTDLAPR